MSICKICKCEFTSKRNPNQQTCSRSCNAKLQIQKRSAKFKPNNCIQCGKELRRLSHLKFCSVKCSGEYHRGDKHHNWKGSKKHRDGYIYVLDRTHPFASNEHLVLEHRIVMEKWLRENKPNSKYLVEINNIKYLKKKAVVHHKNGIKDDNTVSNLGVYHSQSEHIKKHNFRFWENRWN